MPNQNNQEYSINEIYEIDIELIKTDFDLNNNSVDSIVIEDIKESIKNNNLTHPIFLLQNYDGELYLIVGGNILKAFYDLKYKTVPSRIVNGDLDDIKTLQVILFEDTCPLQRAIAMQCYLDKYQLARKSLSQILDLKCNSISEILSLNKLPSEIQNIIINDKRYSLHSLREIARIKNQEVQLQKFERIRKKIERKYSTTYSIDFNRNINSSEQATNDEEQTKIVENQVQNLEAKQSGKVVEDQEFPNKIFNLEELQNYFLKITNEFKKIRRLYKKQDLKRLHQEILNFHEELKALRYKISDDLYVEDD